MTSDHFKLNVRRFSVAEKALRVTSLELMVMDFKRMVSDLTWQIAAEEERTHVSDPAHATYSTLAMSAKLRRTKLLDSVAALRTKLDMARRELEEELQALELTEKREANRQLHEIDRTVAGVRPT
jgi:flagellar protein FliJ